MAHFSHKSFKNEVMTTTGIIGALFLAVLLTVVFSGSFRHRGPWGGLFLFGLIIFLAALSAQIWIHPIGPTAFGISWAPFTFFAFLVAILLVASASSTGKVKKEKTEPLEATEAAPLFAIGIFFWLLLIFFLFIIIFGYYIRPGTTVLAT